MNELQLLLTYMAIVTDLIAQGRTTWTKMRDLLSAAGASDAELAALDARLSDAIAHREAEHGHNG